MTDQIQLRRGTSSQAFTDNFVLALAEPGVETDTGRLAIGDGVSQWESLPTVYTRNVLIETGAVVMSDHYKLHVFTGTSTVSWQLPPVATHAGVELNLINRGTALLDLIPGSSDSMWAESSAGACTTFTVLAGRYYRLICDGYFWIILEPGGAA